MLKQLVDNDRKQIRFQCGQCGWESEWMPIHQAVKPHHECAPKQIKPIFS